MVNVIEPALPSSELVARARTLLRREDPERMVARNGKAEDLAADRHIFNMRVAMGGLASPPATVARPGPAGRAGTLLKRTVRKLTGWYVEPRWSAQAMFDEAVTSMSAELAEFQRQVVRAQVDVAAHTAAMSQQVADLVDQIEAIEAHVTRLGQTTPEIDYVAFEERFRGSSDEVKDAQRDYLERLRSGAGSGPIVDIGCGRGEMLELLRDAGMEACGIDLDAGMLDVCRAKGLAVEHGDALGWLASREDASLGGIFMAQVVEHLRTDDLVELLAIAAAKLAPGGAFIAETIDPRSLYATANHFWADLSHVRPVHPSTLAFLTEQAGFDRVDVLRLSRHELAQLDGEVTEGPVTDALQHLLDVVFGYQDYAVVAFR